MFSQDRNAFRNAFFSVWQKHQRKEILSTVETQILAVMLQHPIYRDIFENGDRYVEYEFAVGENPFLHMSLHLALQEQLNMDKPQGIKQVYDRLLQQINDQHEVEHMMLSCMAEVLAQAQQTGTLPDEKVYLEKLRSLSGGQVF